jgi:hypothetical protein
VNHQIFRPLASSGMIDTFSNSYRTADMFVPVLFIAAISVTILQISTRYQPRLTPWYQPDP